MALFLALVALLVALVIGLGRQVTVLSGFEPGLWFFRRYRKKRLVGIGLILVFSAAALLIEPGSAIIALVSTATAFSIFALLFNLDRLFPALHAVRPVLVEASETEAGALSADANVLVVEIGGNRRAYPLEQMVIPRHLVHDVVGGVPIIVSYCALCRSGLVFRAEHGGEQLFFEVAGVFRRNLLMEDHRTNTLWQQATGEAIFGPLAGKTLEMLPSLQMPWQQARQQSGQGSDSLNEQPNTSPCLVAPGSQRCSQAGRRCLGYW